MARNASRTLQNARPDADAAEPGARATAAEREAAAGKASGARRAATGRRKAAQQTGAADQEADAGALVAGALVAGALVARATVAGATVAGASLAGGPARRTWSRRADARPDEILDAALDEFIAQGFDAARMEDIAARAGLSKGAIYLYFTGKEALLRGLIEREVKPVFTRAHTLAALGGDNPKATIRGIATMINVALGDPRLIAIPLLVISIANRFPDIADYYRREVVEHGRAALEGLISRGVELGQFRKVDPKVASRALIGPLMFEVLWARALKGESDLGVSDAWIEAQFDLLLHGLDAEARA
jgi:AcrR family transcriptional regulator